MRNIARSAALAATLLLGSGAAARADTFLDYLKPSTWLNLIEKKEDKPAEGEMIAWLEWHSPLQRLGGDESPTTVIKFSDGKTSRFDNVAPLDFSPDRSKLYVLETTYRDVIPGQQMSPRLSSIDTRTGSIEEIKIPIYRPVIYQTIGKNIVTKSGCLVMPGQPEGISTIDLITYSGNQGKWKRVFAEKGAVVLNYAVPENADSVVFLLRRGTEVQQDIFSVELDEQCSPRNVRSLGIDRTDLAGYKLDVISNISVSPSGNRIAFTAIHSAMDIPGIREGSPVEDEDIFVIGNSPAEIDRINPGYGFLFERRSHSVKFLKGIEDVIKNIIIDFPNNWRGRELEISDAGDVAFTDDGDVSLLLNGLIYQAAASSDSESAPLLLGNKLLYHSQSRDGGAIRSVDMNYMSTETIAAISGESPYFIIGALNPEKNGTSRQEPRTQSSTETSGKPKVLSYAIETPSTTVPTPQPVPASYKPDQQEPLQKHPQESFFFQISVKTDLPVDGRNTKGEVPFENWLGYIDGINRRADAFHKLSRSSYSEAGICAILTKDIDNNPNIQGIFQEEQKVMSRSLDPSYSTDLMKIDRKFLQMGAQVIVSGYETTISRPCVDFLSQ